jgi:lysozyme
MNEITYRTALEIVSHEAVVREAYKDGGGVWTWSIGITSATGHKVERYIGKPQPMEHCLAVFVWALEKYAQDVRDVFRGYQLTEAEFAAALSFHYNTGAIRKASWVANFKAGRKSSAEVGFKAWNKDNGKVVPGLVTRRAKEADLLFRGKWSATGTVIEYTQLTPRSTPNWSSGKRVNVEAALQAALNIHHRTNSPTGPVPPPAPVQVVPVTDPTPAPSPASEPAAQPTFWGALKAFLVSVFTRRVS